MVAFFIYVILVWYERKERCSRIYLCYHIDRCYWIWDHHTGDAEIDQ